MGGDISDAQIVDAILALCAARGPKKSICPSEAARSLAPDHEAWRSLNPRVREIGARLAAIGRIDITQKGVRLAPAITPRGPVRFRIRGE